METHLSRPWVLATFQNVCSKIHLTVGWKLVKWPMSRWFHRRLASVSPSPRVLGANERLLSLNYYFFLFTPSLLVSPVPFFPLTAPFTQICYCHGEMSHCFQPFQPYFTFLSPPCRHLLSPRPPAASRSLRQSFGCYCQLRHSFQPHSDPVQTPSLNNPHLSSAPRPCCRLLFCHLSVSVSISSRCNRGLCSCISETEHFRLAPSGRSARKMSLWNTSRLVQLRREPKHSSSDSPSGSKLSDLQVWYNNW